MTDEKEIVVEQVPVEILPAPKRKGGRPKGSGKGKTAASAPDRLRSGVTPANQKHRKMAWLISARVIDMEALKRLTDAGLGAKKISRALSTTVATAQKLMRGVHWQQQPERCREFNRAKGASIDPATGVPTANDLAKFGGAYALPKAQDSQGEKDLRAIVESVGVPAHMVEETMRKMRVLAGAAETGDLPAKVDTKFLQDMVDNRLGVLLTVMDPVTLAGASLADQTRAANMLFEKRALLRGEPTQIVRTEHRVGLDKVMGMLMEEAKRRGSVVELKPGPGGYQEVEST